MAVDSRDKRASAILMGLPFGRVLWNPDASMGTADRLHAGLLYRGIATLAGRPRLLTRIHGSNFLPERLSRSQFAVSNYGVAAPTIVRKQSWVRLSGTGTAYERIKRGK